MNGVDAAVRTVPSAWVKCELHALTVTPKITRTEFIELDGEGKQVARVSGACWPGVWNSIRQSFDEAGLRLEAGSEVLVKLEPRFSTVYGFSVTVLEIDVNYALGDLNARMQRIRQALEKAGCWDTNRLLPRPADFLRVAVISPPGAAGLGDFRSTADRLAGAGLATFSYHEAPFQTREAPARIVDILRTLYRECREEQTRHCAVALIRGGGASADLAYLVDEGLVRAVCRMNVPVMTGIGHERDRTLLDEVACIPCDTPSKVAEYISTTITRAATAADHAYGLISSEVRSSLGQREAALADLRHTLYRDAREGARVAGEAVRAAATGLEPGARRLLDQTSNGVSSVVDDVRRLSRQRRERAAEALQTLRQTMQSQVAQSLRPPELGATTAISGIRERVRALPDEAIDKVCALEGAIIDGATWAVDEASQSLTMMRDQLLADARQTIDGCDRTIEVVSTRAEALDPRNVLGAGYAILRDVTGAPLTGVAAVDRTETVVAEMRDGSTTLQHSQPITMRTKA